MIELSTKKELSRIILIESTLRKPKLITESSQFKSVYIGKGGMYKTISWRVVKEYPEFGYKVVKEFMKELPNGIDVAYTIEDNLYIGTPKDAKYFCETRGIKPELANINSNVCSIGKCIYKDKTHEDYGKWAGYSHRAIYLFGYDYVVKEGDCVEGYFPLGFVPKTEEDCRNMAIAFSNSVS